MVFERLIISLILQYYQQIIAIDPNLGKEMGKMKGDKINASGNDGITWAQRIFQQTLTWTFMIISIIFNSEYSLTFSDYLLFVTGTIGTIICFWTYRTLGQFYTFTIGIRENHKLIETGPYEYVAHPGYLGQLMLLVSTTLFYSFNVYITGALIFYMLYVYAKRIREEEEMLMREFSNAYKVYQGGRKRLIPYIF